MLISLSQAIEPVTHGQCEARSAVTFPANGRYQFILLGEQRHIVCEQLGKSRYMKRSGRHSKPATLGRKRSPATSSVMLSAHVEQK